MAPILIDNRGLIKLGLISLLAVLVVFSAGYFIGYQKAAVFYTSASEIETLALPERDLVGSSDIDPQSPDIISVGEEIDVDQPAVINPLGIQEKANKVKQVENIAVTTKSAPSKASIETSLPSKATVKAIQKRRLEGIQTPDSSIVDNSIDTKRVDISSLTNVELNKIKYSVQVGMYGNLANAENMVEMLLAKQFDAYVVDYTTKKNEIRYNVRFGYFTDKKAATKSLKRYKDAEKGDGYLVNFSIDNIVNLADKNTIKDNVKPASSIELLDDNKPSETGSGKVTHNKTSEENYLSKLQSKALINH